MVSVVIPCYNAQNTIIRGLHSVLAQTYTDYEIILIDDGSIDDTQRAIKEFFKDKNIDYKYIYQENSGPSAARNQGIRNAVGEYIAFLDSDDEWHPQKLEIMLKILEDKKINILGHGYTLTENFSQKYFKGDIKKIKFYKLLIKNFAVTPSLVIRRDICQLFDKTMKYSEDHELWLRMSAGNDVYYLDLPLVLLGRKPLTHGGLSSRKWEMRKGEIKMYLKVIKYKQYILPIIPLLVMFSLAKHLRGFIVAKRDNAD